MPTTSATLAAPAEVRVHYRDLDGTPRSVVGYPHARQYEGRFALVLNESAWNTPGVCCWTMTPDRITRVEVIRPEVELTANEQTMLAILAEHDGPITWLHVADLVEGERHDIDRVLQSLIACGRVRLVHSAGPTPGVLTLA